MNKIMLIAVLLIFLIAIIIGVVFLNQGTVQEDISGDIFSGDVEKASEEVFVPVVDKTYGNGTSFVSYKGNIYYVELLNEDYENSTISRDFAKSQLPSSTQRWVNIIHPNGKVENLFKITGATEISIYDDKFYYTKSNGMLHFVDMAGKNDQEIGRGSFVHFDTDNHKAYYTLSNDNNTLWSMDMRTLEISSEPYSNAYANDDNYVFLGYHDDALYYYKIDSSYDSIMFAKHDMSENKDFILSTQKIEKTKEEKTFATEVGRYINRLNASDDNHKFISIGYLDGSGLFFTYGKLYEFNMPSGDSVLISDLLSDERVSVIDDKLYYSEGYVESFDIVEYDINTKKKEPLSNGNILGDKSLISYNGVYSYIPYPYSANVMKAASNYGLYESAFKILYSGDLVDTYPYISGYSEYDVFASDIRVIGRNVIYTLNYGRLNPTIEEFSRGASVPVYVRRATETYLYNLDSENNTLIYAINNSDFIKELRTIENQVEKDIEAHKQEEEEEYNSKEPSGEPMSQNNTDYTYIEIDTSTIWKNEFDVRVEEIGGTIFGKRIEYEGHHLKSEGKLKIKITKEHNARLIVYIDNDVFSDTVID